MWRSKSMLSIIPIEIIAKMPRIHQFLIKRSFKDIKVNPDGSSKASSKPHHGAPNLDAD